MLFNDMAPYLGGVSDQQARVIRFLYEPEKRYTRPYVAAMMGISAHQVLIEEVAALRVIIEIMAKEIHRKPKALKPEAGGGAAAVGTKQTRNAKGTPEP